MTSTEQAATDESDRRSRESLAAEYRLVQLTRGGKAGPWHAMNPKPGYSLSMCGKRLPGINQKSSKSIGQEFVWSKGAGVCGACVSAVLIGQQKPYRR